MKERNHTIELFRFLFAGIVVLHHSRYLFGDENCWFLGGSLAVEFFLFVSGYLMMEGVEKANAGERMAAQNGGAVPALGRETLQFLFRRMRGFLPEYLIAWSIGFVFIAAVRHWSAGQLWDAFRDDFWELTLVKMSGLFTHGIDGVMWYLSAMLLVMAVLYPLLRRYQDVMLHLVCPLAALFLYGWLCREEGHPRDPVVWTGLFYKGLIRTAAGLCAGVVVHGAVRVCQRKAPRGLTLPGNLLAVLVQLACLFLTIRYMLLEKPSREDYFFMFLLLLLVWVTFTGWGIERLLPPAGCRAADALGHFSLPLYLGHLYFAQHLNEIAALEGASAAMKMGLYVALALANGLVIMGFAAWWRHSRKRFAEKLQEWLIGG